MLYFSSTYSAQRVGWHVIVVLLFGKIFSKKDLAFVASALSVTALVKAGHNTLVIVDHESSAGDRHCGYLERLLQTEGDPEIPSGGQFD